MGRSVTCKQYFGLRRQKFPLSKRWAAADIDDWVSRFDKRTPEDCVERASLAVASLRELWEDQQSGKLEPVTRRTSNIVYGAFVSMHSDMRSLGPSWEATSRDQVYVGKASHGLSDRWYSGPGSTHFEAIAGTRARVKASLVDTTFSWMGFTGSTLAVVAVAPSESVLEDLESKLIDNYEALGLRGLCGRFNTKADANDNDSDGECGSGSDGESSSTRAQASTQSSTSSSSSSSTSTSSSDTGTSSGSGSGGGSESGSSSDSATSSSSSS